MRKTVKFVGEDNVSKMVNVEGAKDTQEVLLRVLKKFGKIPSNSFPSSNPNRGRNDHGDYFAEMEGYGVFSSTPDGSSTCLSS
jgi:mitogen-activated protein kinase kinase kinase